MKIKTCLLGLTLFVLSTVVSAQEAPKNVVKLNLPALAAPNISLQYERAIHKNFSLAFQAGVLLERGLPKQIDLGENSDFGDLAISGFNCSPEIRFYPGKKEKKTAPRGFYLAPYGRYSRYTATAFFMYADSSSMPVQESPVDFKGTFTGIGGGLLIGAQFIIKDRFSIDWWILGGHFGVSKLKGTMDSPLVANNSDDFKQDIENSEIPYGTTTVEVLGSQASVIISDLPFAGIRSGLCIGIAF